jgi:signal transduction histidine kinase
MTGPTPEEMRAGPDEVPLVLVVEDDPSSAKMLEALLQHAGYRVRVAEDGAAALAMLDEAPPPDVLLLDWMLPEVTGLELCRAVRQRWDELSLPILMVTAKTDPESISAAFQAGASDYITKPFLGADLRARVAARLRTRRLVDERHQMHERMIERETLSTLGLLVSGVAHDLNNPLAGIFGHAQLLVEEERDPERLVALERILSEVQRCNRIVAELLTYSRRQAPERGAVDVREVLHEMVELRQRSLQGSGIHLRVEAPEELPTILADAGQLQRVFLNILINAEHAMREGGSTVVVTAESVPPPAGGGSPWLAIRFFNDGPAIPRDVLPRIFDPLFTTKGEDEGTGLGLAICRRIVREHGGEIGVESGPKGTAFRVLLPPAGS